MEEGRSENGQVIKWAEKYVCEVDVKMWSISSLNIFALYDILVFVEARREVVL